MLDLVSKRNWFYLLSFLVVLPGVISLMIPPRLKPGIEFTSGTTFSFRYAPADVFTVNLPVQIAPDNLQKGLTSLGYDNVKITPGSAKQVSITVSDVKNDGKKLDQATLQSDLTHLSTLSGAAAGATASIVTSSVDTPSAAGVRSLLSAVGHPEAQVQTAGPNQFVVQTSEIEGSAQTAPVGPSLPSGRDTVESKLSQAFGGFLDTQGKPTTQFTDFSSISAAVSRSIGRNAAIAVLWASLAITLYITWAFHNVPNSLRYGVSAIVALLHDVLLVVGVFSILGKTLDIQVDTYFITGVLTVVGFSVHDSIVVFDRIRENVERGVIRNFPQTVNHSLLQTMGRSFNTSLTLIFSILALLLLGGGSIRTLLLVLLVGVSTGTYSSVFIASMFLLTWQQGDIPRLWRRIRGLPPKPVPGVQLPVE